MRGTAPAGRCLFSVETGAPTPPSPASAFYARTFALLALAVVSYLLFQVLRPFLAPIAWAFFIAFLLHPAHARMLRKMPAGVSAGLLTAATIVVLLGPLAGLVAAFGAQVADLLKYAQELAAEHRSTPADLASMPVLGPALAWLQETTGISFAQIQAWAVEVSRAVLKPLAALGQQAVLGALGTAIGFFMMIFILFFAIRDGRAVFSALRDLIPAPAEDRARLFSHLAEVTRAMVFGTGITALVQGALVGIGFAIAGLPSPIVFGVLAALLALVPMMGTPVVWAPAVIYLAANGRWGMATFLLAWGVFVITIDNVLRPMLVSGRADVGTLTVFVGVLGGVSAFGPIGIFLGPLVLALVIALIRFILEARQGAATARSPSASPS
jgi:predicted PurR-regulated permease PerM